MNSDAQRNHYPRKWHLNPEVSAFSGAEARWVELPSEMQKPPTCDWGESLQAQAKEATQSCNAPSCVEISSLKLCGNPCCAMKPSPDLGVGEGSFELPFVIKLEKRSLSLEPWGFEKSVSRAVRFPPSHHWCMFVARTTSPPTASFKPHPLADAT